MAIGAVLFCLAVLSLWSRGGLETSDLLEGENDYDVLDVVSTRSKRNIYDSINFDPREVLSSKTHKQSRSFVPSTFCTMKTESLPLSEVEKEEMDQNLGDKQNNVVHIRRKTTGDEEKSGSPISRMKR